MLKRASFLELLSNNLLVKFQGSLAKTCRNLQLKLKRTQQLRLQQKARAKSEQSRLALLEGEGGAGAGAVANGAEIAPSISGEVVKAAAVEAEPEGEAGGELWKSAAIW